jgi:hypothetical protein
MSRALDQSLLAVIANDPQSFSELVETSRKFIGAWVNAGGDSTDKLILPFVSIDSQADDVGRWGVTREVDETDFYRTFYPAFIEARDDVRKAVLEG